MTTTNPTYADDDTDQLLPLWECEKCHELTHSGPGECSDCFRARTTRWIPVENVRELARKIEKLNRKARRRGFPEIQVTLGEFMTCVGKREVQVRRLVTIEGDRPRFSGWQVTAVLDWGTLGGVDVLVHRVTDDAMIPATAFDRSYCDHCKTRRNRSKVVVLSHPEKGVMVVGKTCLKDFLVTTTPQEILFYATWEKDLDAACRESLAGSTDLFPTGWPTDLFLAVCIEDIREHGFISKSNATMANPSTAENTVELFYQANKVEKAVEVSDAALVEARELIEWILNGDDTPDGDYGENLRKIVAVGYVTMKTAGYIASIPSARGRVAAWGAREEAKRLQEEANGKLVHIGTPKKREVFTLTVLGKHGYENSFGGGTLVRFADPEGNLAVWFASSGAYDLKEGETYEVKATVKSHGDHDGAAQTVINRCAIQA